MHRKARKLKSAMVSIAVVLCACFQFQTQMPSQAQGEKQIEDSALLIEGEPGFKKPEKEVEEVKIEKPKISEGVEFYFSTMFNLLVAGGVVLVIIGIYTATKKKE
jgi:hypothetical protein